MTPAPLPTPTGPSRRGRLAVVLGALTAFAPLSIDLYLPAFPTLTERFGTAEAGVQLTLTACLAGLALGQLVAGPLSDALGRRRPLLVGLVLYVLASLVCALAPSVEALTAARLLQGLAGAAGLVIARAVVRDLYTGVAMARFFSMLMLVNGVAPIVAPVLGSLLLRVTPWPGLFLFLAGYGLVLLVAVVLALPETLPAAARRSGRLGDTMRVMGELLADRRFVGYAASAGLVFAAMFTYISGSSFVLQDAYRLSPQQFGLAFGVNALGIMAFGQLSRMLLTRFPPARLLLAGLVLAGVGAVALVAAVSAGLGLPVVLPALFAVVASVGLVMPNATALALAGRPEQAGSASALLGVLQFVFGAVAAPLVGTLAGVLDRPGAQATALAMAGLMCALALAALLVYGLLTRGPAPEPSGTDRPAAGR